MNQQEKLQFQTNTVSSFAIKLEADELKISRLSTPIDFTLKSSQQNINQSIINMSLPGQLYYAEVNNIKTSCNMVVSLSMDDILDMLASENANLTLRFYLKIGQPPTTSNFDLYQEFELSGEMTSSDNQVNNSSRKNFTRTIFKTDNSDLFRELDSGSILLSNLSRFSYYGASSASNNNNRTRSIRDTRANTSIYFAFTYDGYLPPVLYTSNIYTYDTLDIRSKFPLILRSYCAECRYWNETNSKWQTDGLEVCIISFN